MQFDGEWQFDGECKRISQINQLLKDNYLELLSDAAKRQTLHPQDTVAGDNEAHDVDAVQMIHKAILSVQLHLPFLHRTKLGPSNINRAGLGIFATKDIAKREAITCYPGDAVLY